MAEIHHSQNTFVLLAFITVFLHLPRLTSGKVADLFIEMNTLYSNTRGEVDTGDESVIPNKLFP